jgi:hypothetical protein
MRIALARRALEALAIEDGDLAVAISNQFRVLELECGRI